MTAAGRTDAPAVLRVVTFDAPGLGDRSYLLSDGESAVVVDPQRDPSPYLLEAEKLGLTIRAVVETHIHNDYVTGGLALARACGATYAIPGGEPVSFEGAFTALGDNDVLRAGGLEVTAIATTGHTDHHLAYVVALEQDGAGAQRVVCTGGSLLAGATGRTDLLGAELAESLAHAQWRSARRLLALLPTDTRVLPTHGFGSFCSASSAEGPGSEAITTIASELDQNPAAVMEEDEFVKATLANPPPIPAYYRFMAPLNRRGPSGPDLGPAPLLDIDALADAAVEGPWLLDLRSRRRFAASHLRGTVNLELGDSLPTYMGWIVPFEAQYILVGDHEGDIENARRLLAQIGREIPLAVGLWRLLADGSTGAARVASYPVASFADLASALAGGESPLVLDVRHPHEWSAGHLAVASHIPVTELAWRREELETNRTVWVHCGGGYRAAAAASLLSARGLSPVLIDDSWQHAVETGLQITAN